MKELVVISGKGGTGKTSIAASLAVLAGRCVVADCDVDAADLHLVLSPRIKECHDFYSGHQAVIRQTECTSCGMCLAHCRYGAVARQYPAESPGVIVGSISYDCQSCDYCERSCPARDNDFIQAMSEAIGQTRQGAVAVDPIACEGCGVCVQVCPAHAIDFPERLCGEWMVSETRCGPMVHARLGVASENSGKLVSIVRQNARRIAEEQDLELIIVDGAPGIGCPVIASVTGAALVLVVTEPTLSGEHDLKRVVQLARHFDIPLTVCINKWDLNPEMSDVIEAYCREHSIPVAGRIRYHRMFTDAQVKAQTVVEASDHGASVDIRRLWSAVRSVFGTLSPQEEPHHGTSPS
ncbi:MAG: ATP-binding protein [Phycisphaerae bacterium]